MKKLLLLLIACMVSMLAFAQTERSVESTGYQSVHNTQQPTTTTQISSNVNQFYYLVTTGPGRYDHIGIHRVTRVDANGNPKPSDNAILMVHGDIGPFDQAFFGGISRDSVAAYLASQGIDVWGIDLAWTLVPAGENDFTFMKNWGMQHDINDIETALTFARSIRSQTGSDNGPLTLLGYSRGGWLGYGLLNQETQVGCNQRQAKAYISVDNFYKTNSQMSQQVVCSAEAYALQEIASGIYDSDGSFYATVGVNAIQAPDAISPPALCDSPYTNLTCSLLLASAGFQIGPSFTPYYHLAAGFFPGNNYTTGIPDGLVYANAARFNALEVGLPPYEPQRLLADTYGVTCGDDPNLPFDKHLANVTVPIHYVGAGGAFGSYGLYTLSLLGSREITHHIISFYPPDQQALDFAHVDLFYADNAKDLVWSDMLDWLSEPHGTCSGH